MWGRARAPLSLQERVYLFWLVQEYGICHRFILWAPSTFPVWPASWRFQCLALYCFRGRTQTSHGWGSCRVASIFQQVPPQWARGERVGLQGSDRSSHSLIPPLCCSTYLCLDFRTFHLCSQLGWCCLETLDGFRGDDSIAYDRFQSQAHFARFHWSA